MSIMDDCSLKIEYGNRRVRMMKQQNYAKETKTAVFKGKPITVTHITPALSAEERAKRKRDIESQLYDVFVKYNDKSYRAG